MRTFCNYGLGGYILVVVALCCAKPVPSFAAEVGADLYDQECADCHSLAKPPKNKKGPSLVGIMGKPAAAVPNFAYSDALKLARIVWTADKMDAYIENPKALISGGGKMKYDGLKNVAQRTAIIEFLNRQQ
jgi:cytochrome c